MCWRQEGPLASSPIQSPVSGLSHSIFRGGFSPFFACHLVRGGFHFSLSISIFAICSLPTSLPPYTPTPTYPLISKPSDDQPKQLLKQTDFDLFFPLLLAPYPTSLFCHYIGIQHHHEVGQRFFVGDLYKSPIDLYINAQDLI